MKQLSIEEKAKRYNEALKEAVVAHKDEDKHLKATLERIFPELKESEDEKHRKWILEYLYDGLRKSDEQFKDHFKAAIAWLEKQGEREPKFRIGDTIKKKSTDDIVTVSEVDLKNREYRLSNTGFIPFKYEYLWELVEQKPAFEMKTPEESLGVDSDTYNKIVDECVYGEQKPVDTVEPKFHEGDFIKHNKANIICKVISVNSGSYYVENIETSGRIELFNARQNFHLWTIKDAKDGDVLTNGKMVVIFKHFEEPSYRQHIVAYIGLDRGGDIQITDDTWRLGIDKAKPATKEQRAFLFQRMKEAGYEWDYEKKELKKIEQKPADDMERKYNPYYNMSFEEAQEYISNRGFDIPWTDCDVFVDFRYVTQTVANILRWADDNPRQKPAWSEEDEKRLESIIEECSFHKGRYKHEIEESAYYTLCEKNISWLKFLKERYTWKPSDEHYELEEFAKIVRGNLTGISKAVQKLFEAKYLQLTGNKMYGGFKD